MRINRFRLKFHWNFHFGYHICSVLILHITFFLQIYSNYLSLPIAFLRFIDLPWQLLMVDGNGLLHPRGKHTNYSHTDALIQYSSNSMVRIASFVLVDTPHR
jgi:hypothetical protein